MFVEEDKHHQMLSGGVICQGSIITLREVTSLLLGRGVRLGSPCSLHRQHGSSCLGGGESPDATLAVQRYNILWPDELAV